MITQQKLKELLNYNQDTGIFTWISKSKNKISIGYTAGTKNFYGYIIITLKGKRYRAHRLAWLYVNGKFPKNCIDHINNNPSDNRICNLREATYKENSCNQKLKKNNKSGVKGVTWHKVYKKWQARISVNSKRILLGFFDDLEFAELVINEARQKYHGEYANNG
jgi:hypothetical protein